MLAGVLAPQLISFPPRSGLLLAVFAVLVVILPRIRRRDLLLLAAGAGSFLLSLVAAIDARLDPDVEGDSVLVDVRIADFPRRQGDVVRFAASPLSEPRLPARLQLSWFEAPVDIRLGDTWQFELRLRRPRGNRNPGSGDVEARYLSAGIGATGYVVNGRHNLLLDSGVEDWIPALRTELDRRIERVIEDDDAAAVIAAVGIGARHRLDPEQWQRYAATGTSHLMAISGLHVGLAAVSAYSLCLLLVGAAGRCRNPHDVAIVAGLLVASGYAILSGFSMPARRATLMLGVAAFALLRRREANGMHVLATVALAICLTDPLATLSAGFRLSFAAVLVLLLAARWRVPEAGGLLLRPYRALVRLTSAQFALFLGLLPLTALMFGRVSLGAPLVNLVAVPVFGIVTVPMTLAGLALGGPLEAIGNAALCLAAWSVNLLERLIALAAVDALSGPVAGFVGSAWLLLVLPFAWIVAPPGVPGRAIAWLAALGVVLWRPPALPGGCSRIDILDVGQGLAVVIQTSRHAMLYDTGPAYRSGSSSVRSIVAPFLAYRGIRSLDRVIVSHADLDHAGGVEDLLDMLPVALLVAGEPPESGRVDAMCEAGMQWEWDGVRFDVLHPGRDDRSSGNDASCVLLVSAGSRHALLTGDIESRTETVLVRGRRLPTADLVVVPHHGSRTSSIMPFVRAVDPGFAVVSSGYGNRWGLPVDEVVARWRAVGAEVLNTAYGGAITFSMCAGGPATTVNVYRETHRRAWHRIEAERDRPARLP